MLKLITEGQERTLQNFRKVFEKVRAIYFVDELGQGWNMRDLSGIRNN